MNDFDVIESQIRNQAWEVFKDALLQALNPVFELGIDHVSWRQYTPDYCDGDPCEFRVDEPEIRIDEKHWLRFDDLEFNLKYYNEKLVALGIIPTNAQLISETVYECFKKFRSKESLLRFMCGESSRITVYNGWLEVEDYEWVM